MTDLVNLKDAIATLAEMVLHSGLSAEFRRKAKLVSATISVDDFTELKDLLHNPPREPATFDIYKHGLGGWLSACQFSVFEVVFCVGEPALPIVRQIAWGSYDWTQGNAIEVLIRLAAQGTRSEEIVAEIKSKFSDIRYEAQLYALEPLLPLIDSDENLRSVVNQLMQNVQFAEAYNDVTRY